MFESQDLASNTARAFHLFIVNGKGFKEHCEFQLCAEVQVGTRYLSNRRH